MDKINNEITDINKLSDLGTNVIHISDPREQNCTYHISIIYYQNNEYIIK